MSYSTRIRIFTEASADADNINAQSLSVRQIVSRLDIKRYDVLMTRSGPVDPLLHDHPNLQFTHFSGRGRSLKQLFKFMSWNPDIFFYPLPSPLTEMLLVARRFLRLRFRIVVHVVTIYSLYEPAIFRWFGAYAVQRAISLADAVVANSSFVAACVARDFGREATVIHNGINTTCFFPGPPRSNPRPVALYAGSFRPYKNVMKVVDLARRLPDVDFMLVGDGEERQTCEQAAPANMRFVGSVNQQELGKLMRQADIFVFPSLIEGHPQVLGQAAACGLPAVAMAHYQPDYVVSGETGFLCSDEAEFDLKAALLVRNPELRERMGTAAVAHAAKFNWDNSARQWASLFESLMPNRT